MWSDWQQLIEYLKDSFSIKGDMLSVLFLVGIQEAGTGFRHYSQEEKTGLIKLAKYILLSNAGYYQKIDVPGRDPLFIPNENVSLPNASELVDSILKKELLTYFNKTL